MKKILLMRYTEQEDIKNSKRICVKFPTKYGAETQIFNPTKKQIITAFERLKNSIRDMKEGEK